MTGASSRTSAGLPLPLMLLLALALIPLAAGQGCQLPGQRSAVVSGGNLGFVLDQCARAAEGMHFRVKAIDRAHHILVAEGAVEGDLTFHEVRLSVKVVHVGGNRYRVEAIATADARGIRAGAERKTRELFFRELRETGIVVEE